MKTLKRLFVAAVCAALCVTVLAACAEKEPGKAEKLTIGVIQFVSHPSLDNCYEGLIAGLKDAGFVDGDNMEIDFQNALGLPETADQQAKNLVAKKCDLLIGIATPAAMAAYAATRGTDIPVVFCAVSDPVAAELVKTLEKPGVNCTGTSDLLNLEAQVKMIRAFQPDAAKLGVLYTTSEVNSVTHLTELKELAPKYNFEVVAQGVQSSADIPQAITVLAEKVDCITNFTDNNVVKNLSTVLAKANAAGVPVYGSEIEQVTNGCIASESLDYIELGKRTGAMAAKILNGESAAEIPVALIKDSKPVVNPGVMAAFSITLPDAYAGAEKVTK